MLSRTVIAAAGALLSALPAASLAQSPIVDGALGPVVGRMLPRMSGRSAAMPELFNGLNPFRTPALNTVVLMHEDSLVTTGPRRMGVVQPVGLTSANAGRWTQLDDGGWLWVATIEATGALATRLEITPWPLVSGSQFTLYNTDDATEAFGPFDGSFLTGAESFWSPTIYSPNVTVEYYLPPGINHLAPASQLTVSNLLNQYRSPAGGQGGPDELGCHLDVTCQPTWAAAATGVAALSTINNQFGFFCTGSMMNRAGADFTPLFQTASHCGITTANASTILVTWFFQTTSCNGAVPPLNTLPQTLGAVLLSRDPGTDWTLIGLRSGSPAVTFEGWDANYVPPFLNIVNISHPDGAFKRIAFGTKFNDFGTLPNGSNGCDPSIQYGTSFNPGAGLTEPGSSGSPLFDGTQHIRACLSCGATPTCSGTNFNTWGRLDLAFNGLAPFLTPPNPVFANANFGGNERGTPAEPFRSLGKSMYSVLRGSTVNMQAGSYSERLTVDKAMTLQAIGGIVTIGQ